MSPFGSTYRWRNTMNTITYYVLRRILGALARVLDRMDRREAERRGDYPNDRYCSTEGLEYNPKRDMWKTPGTWIPGDGGTQDGPGTPETTTGSSDTAIGPIRGTREAEDE